MTDLFAHLVNAIDRARIRMHPVQRPQDCNCGSNTLINVAHWERCASRG